MDEENEGGGCEGVASDDLTMNRKWILFHRHQYKMPPPPVPTVYWGVDDWVRYIDKHGEWLYDREEREEEGLQEDGEPSTGEVTDRSTQE